MNSLLIDGNSLMYRAYYGSAYSPAGVLKNSKGQAVNAVLTFNKMIERIIKAYPANNILIAFDAGKKTRRHEKLESYKAGRASTPPELITQFPIAKEMLDLMGIKRFEMQGIEADDIIATAAFKLASEGRQAMIVSSDRDLFQMVSDKITIIVPQNGAKPDLIMTPENFVEVYGVLPHQVADLKGIMGDTSDNLEGVKGIGEKGAMKLIADHGSLEGIYENIASLTPSVQQKLNDSREMAFLCKELATLDRHVELPFDLVETAYKGEVSEELIEFFKLHELNSLVKRYQTEVKEKVLHNIIF